MSISNDESFANELAALVEDYIEFGLPSKEMIDILKDMIEELLADEEVE
jgi:DNA-binding transcriptional regulator YhcF (GntR family)